MSAPCRAAATKKSHEVVRDKYKVMMLATQYGMAAETLAARLGISTLEAHEMLRQHRSIFAQYWKWSDDWVQHALADRDHAYGHGLDLPRRRHRIQ